MLLLSREEKQAIEERILGTLQRDPNVVFAYLFGSFLESVAFRDIDVGVYLQKIEKEAVPLYEENTATVLARVLNVSPEVIDVTVLNFAPRGFLASVFRWGMLLFTRDEAFLADLIERVSLEVLADAHVAFASLKELASP